MSAPVVPFFRPLYGPGGLRGDHPLSLNGPDVEAVGRALVRGGFLEAPPGGMLKLDRAYNRRKVEAVKTLQRHAGITPTGNYGRATHEALRLTHFTEDPAEYAFDEFAIRILVGLHKQEDPVARAQKAGVDAALYWILHNAESHYSWHRPYTPMKPPAVPTLADCSVHAELVYFAADAPDPSGRDFDGQAYTGTQVGRGRQVGLGELELLDLVFYGYTPSWKASSAFPTGSPTHVAVYIGGGYVSSNGSESGPQKRPVRYRSDIHSARRYALVA